ncbi:MAG: fumarate hydratase [Candidatus Margulisiibacteriota bacterium]|nr:MAG: fumarate hydratase [Candidatus Margulisbacteria bacterium GWE2_39_32]PZM82995.1 MAG: fumarate hydratase [Candidatus Margulisiibacteriota bacterium]HCY37455.1 fumarate hydratase [Candidatus Margulisiibacteriota bacterium]
MKIINCNQIIKAIRDLCINACLYLPTDVQKALELSKTTESSCLGQEILDLIIQNTRIAATNQIPLCQDTGFAVFFIELGQEVHISGGDLYSAINTGVSKGYQEGYLRKSIVKDPLRRKNTENNTPAIIHTSIVPGDSLKISFCPKGGGAENMSKLAMLKPSDGWEGIKRFVIATVTEAEANPCPPIIVGIGIGGTFEYCALLAKKALLRQIDDINDDDFYAKKEIELLQEINKLNIGPAGFGGTTTALSVKINSYPCHIASLPVAINIQCHSSRHKEIIL